MTAVGVRIKALVAVLAVLASSLGVPVLDAAIFHGLGEAGTTHREVVPEGGLPGHLQLCALGVDPAFENTLPAAPPISALYPVGASNQCVSHPWRAPEFSPQRTTLPRAPPLLLS